MRSAFVFTAHDDAVQKLQPAGLLLELKLNLLFMLEDVDVLISCGAAQALGTAIPETSLVRAWQRPRKYWSGSCIFTSLSVSMSLTRFARLSWKAGSRRAATKTMSVLRRARAQRIMHTRADLVHHQRVDLSQQLGYGCLFWINRNLLDVSVQRLLLGLPAASSSKRMPGSGSFVPLPLL